MLATFLLYVLAFGQATNTEILIGPTAILDLSWDAVTTDIEGKPETIAGYEVSIGTPTIDPNLNPELITGIIQVPADTRTADGIPLFLNKSMGKYHIFVRAIDAAGNWSIYSDPLEITWDPVPPAKPTLRYKVTIQIEITSP